MKVNMSKTQFKELLEEYISNLEKDYDSNQTGNSNHPTYSLINNTYRKFEDKYYSRKLGFNITYFLFGLIYLAITFGYPSLPLVILKVFPLMILIFVFLVLHSLSRFCMLLNQLLCS